MEDKFIKLGKDLASSPLASVDELYTHLEEIDGLLSNIEQSPSQKMLIALRPLMKALAGKNFLGHPDMDVKVAVATCISEITRITAPEAPYDDNIMKEIFQMIVGAFAGLDNMSSRSFQKRVSILETVAKVRSCVVMLDLECEDLILEMFRLFLKTIRNENSENVFSCMETIMTLVIEESEDISTELLSVLLYTLKNDKDVLPIAQHLAEQVLRNCADKIKPCLVDLVQRIGAPMSEYHKVVASICQENSNALDIKETHAEVKAEGSNLSEKATSDELPKVSSEREDNAGYPENVDTQATSQIAVTSNGSVQNGNGDSMEHPSSPIQKFERSLENGNPEIFVSDNAGCNVLESNVVKPDDTDRDAQAVTGSADDCSKEADNPKNDDASTTKMEPSVSNETEKNNGINITPHVKVPTMKTEPLVLLEIERQNVVKITNNDIDAVVDPPASISVQKSFSSNIHTHDDVVSSKDDDVESSKGDDVEALTTVESDSVMKSRQSSVGKKGRKGKKGRFLKGKSSSVGGKKEKDPSNEILPSKCDESEEHENANDVEARKNLTNDLGLMSKTKGRRGRPKKGDTVEKEKYPSDEVLPLKGDESEKEPENADDVEAPKNLTEDLDLMSKTKGKRGRPKKGGAVVKEKFPSEGNESEKEPENTNDVEAPKSSTKGKRGRPKKEAIVEKDIESSDEVLPLKGDESDKEPENAYDVEEPKSSTNDADMMSKTKGKRGRPKKDVPVQESLIKNKSNAKKQKGEDIFGTDGDKESNLKDMASSCKSASKAQIVDKANLDDNDKPRSRRKRAANIEDTSKNSPDHKKELDGCLVGSKIKVWWPDDKRFYDGVVQLYDPVSKKHKIVYTDGDVEVLTLKNERWEYVGSGETPQIKKAKVSTNMTPKQAKSEEQARSVEEPSNKDTPRPRGRPKKGSPNPDPEKVSYDGSPETAKKSEGKASSDEKTRRPKFRRKYKGGVTSDYENQRPRTSVKSKSKNEIPVSGTKLKITSSKEREKVSENESTPAVSDNEATKGSSKRRRKGQK